MKAGHRRCGCKLTDACTCPMGATTQQQRGHILHEAARLVTDNRAAQHGSFEQNCTDAAAICNTLGVAIQPEHVPLILHALKLARMRQNPAAADNYVDAAGYLQLLAEVRGVQVESPATR